MRRRRHPVNGVPINQQSLVVPAEYSHPSEDKPLTADGFLNRFRIKLDNDSGALSFCPAPVAVAMCYSHIWRFLLYANVRILQQMAFAFDAAHREPHHKAYGWHEGTAEVWTNGGGAGFLNYFLGHLGKYQNGRAIRGFGAGKIDFSEGDVRRGGHADIANTSGKMSAYHGVVSGVHHHYEQWLEDYYVRPKKDTVMRFARAVRPLFCPYLHVACDNLFNSPKLWTVVERERSSKLRPYLPFALHSAMEEIALVFGRRCGLLYDAFYHCFHQRSEIEGEIAAYKEAREAYSYAALNSHGNLTEALREYDARAEIGYLSPVTTPRRQTLTYGEIHFRGLNGEGVTDQTPKIEERS
jgi:hypothetical protein